MTPAFAQVTEGVDAVLSSKRPRKVAAVEPAESAQERLEIAVVGSVAVDDRAAAELSKLSPSDFTFPRVAAAFVAVIELRMRGAAVTATSIAAEMEAQGAPAAYRAQEFLDGLLAAAEPSAVSEHVGRLKEGAARRRAAVGLHEVSAAIARREPAADVAAAIAVTGLEAQEAATWPDPVPLDAGDAPAWPSDVLRGPMGELVEAVADTAQVPRDMPAMLALGIISTVCAGRMKVQLHKEWSEGVNLFLAVAMPSGSRKTTVMRAVTAPIVAYESAEADKARGAYEEAQSDLRIAEKRRARLEAAVASAKDDEARDKAKEALKIAATELSSAREKAAETRAPRLMTSDATPEALTSLLADNEGRMAVISAEGGDLFDMMAGRYSQGVNMAVYLMGHAGDTIRVDRKGRATEYIRDPSLSVVVATQPDTFTVFAKHREMRERGLVARFLFGVPPSNIGFRDTDPSEADPEVASRWDDTVRGLLRQPLGFDARGKPSPHTITLDADAAEFFKAFHQTLEGRHRPGQDLFDLADWGSKAAGATARIAALIHAAEGGDGAPPWAMPISLDTIERAARIMLGYFIPHAKIAFMVMGDTAAVVGARRLIDKIRSGIVKRGEVKAVFTARDALRALDRNGSRKEVLDPVLEVLLAHGWVREIDPERGRGRPSQKFAVHPWALRKRP